MYFYVFKTTVGEEQCIPTQAAQMRFSSVKQVQTLYMKASLEFRNLILDNTILQKTGIFGKWEESYN